MKNKIRTPLADKVKVTSFPERVRAFGQSIRSLPVALQVETDRVAVILVAGFIEELAEYLIINSSHCEKIGMDLLKYPSPLSQFKTKLDICHSLGLISADEIKASEEIRKLRNKAAHIDFSIQDISFSFQSKQSLNRIETFCQLMHVPFKPESARDCFVLSSNVLLQMLLFRLVSTTKPLTPICFADAIEIDPKGKLRCDWKAHDEHNININEMNTLKDQICLSITEFYESLLKPELIATAK